ncbi:nuclear receptor subfamily 1 def [Plakobranchus ocellatus]|uniref:Nuclear receptor subfamily 1 def n=1 Tax=Plakobranchus ocellatus TaxID=259542 RepID=A0AAV4BRI1_9GAST|nr:nuclear receptor subfamily 1 def [Plakobranchus ocellatus]
MAELQKILDAEMAFKSDIMENVLSTLNTTSSTINANLNTAKINKTSTSSVTANMNDNDSSMDIRLIDNSREKTTTTSNINRNTTGASNVVSSDSNLNSNANINSSPAKRDQDQMHFYVDPKANCLADVQSVLNKAKETCDDKKRLIIDQITDVTTDAHMATTLNTQENIREANERIARQQEAMGNQMPDMSKLSLNPSVMMKHFLNSMVPEMTKVVNFSKNLPGFSELDMDDQVKLIKQGIFEVMIARITLLIDNATDTMIDPSLKMKSPRPMVRQMSPLGPFIDQFFDIAKLTNPLNLTDGENGLFGAILILCPDRLGLKNVAGVQVLQQLYLQALHLLMRHNHKDADVLFANLLSSIPTIRKINDEHFRMVSNMKKKSPSDFEAHFPQLHRELFDVSLH